jgi:hypothetical protein
MRCHTDKNDERARNLQRERTCGCRQDETSIEDYIVSFYILPCVQSYVYRDLKCYEKSMEPQNKNIH